MIKLLEKMNKKEKKEYYRKKRVLVGFNTGTRTMKSEKYPSRQKQKDMARSECLEQL